MKNLELIVGELPVFVNHNHSTGFVGRAHIRMREDSAESTIHITCSPDVAKALAEMMLNYTPMGISFVYTKNTPDERNDR